MVFIIITPAAAEDAVITVCDEEMTYATLENASVISRQGFSGGNFTTLQGDTFHYGNALNVTYLNSESVRDYLIVWKCEISDDYYPILDSDWHYYFDYTNDRNGLVYMEISYAAITFTG